MTSTLFRKLQNRGWAKLLISPLAALTDGRRTQFGAEDFEIKNSTDRDIVGYLKAAPPMLANREFELKLALSEEESRAS